MTPQSVTRCHQVHRALWVGGTRILKRHNDMIYVINKSILLRLCSWLIRLNHQRRIRIKVTKTTSESLSSMIVSENVIILPFHVPSLTHAHPINSVKTTRNENEIKEQDNKSISLSHSIRAANKSPKNQTRSGKNLIVNDTFNLLPPEVLLLLSPLSFDSQQNQFTKEGHK